MENPCILVGGDFVYFVNADWNRSRLRTDLVISTKREGKGRRAGSGERRAESGERGRERERERDVAYCGRDTRKGQECLHSEGLMVKYKISTALLSSSSKKGKKASTRAAPQYALYTQSSHLPQPKRLPVNKQSIETHNHNHDAHNLPFSHLLHTIVQSELACNLHLREEF